MMDLYGTLVNKQTISSVPLDDVLFDKCAATADELKNPFNQSQCFMIIGSCHGLMCVFAENGLFIYNPATTRICNVLPCRTINSQRNARWYPFRYDESTKDHKIVEITSTTTNKVYLYYLKTQMWKSLGTHTNLDLWVMTVYRAEETWVKFASFQFVTHGWIDESRVPLFCSNDGKLLFQCQMGFVIYDPKHSPISRINYSIFGEACIVA
ncbi:F-box associated domain containing protein [Tanacetum coccineum]